MTHTVVGLFDNRSEAQAAMQELIQQGFNKESIDLSNRSVSESTAATADTTNTAGDSISNFFGSLFGDDEATTRNYSSAASEADSILTVHVDSSEKAAQAAEILDRNGAIDVDERSHQYQQNFAQTSGTTTENKTTNQNNTAIPVIEEELQIGKRAVETGGARIRSRIIEKPIEETVRLREEHIVVNRQPVNRAVTDADMPNFKEGEINLTKHAEEAVVNKQARVVEEVSVGKQVEERDQVISDTVRRTDVEVEETNADVTTNDATRRATNS